MRKNIMGIIFVCTIALSLVYAGQEKEHNYKPKEGYVPDEKTAIKIAKAVWIPIYGEKQIQDEKPFKARLKNGVWIVTGTLPIGMVGGVAIAEISKDDARVIRVSHGK
jgi:hypothetical protein